MTVCVGPCNGWCGRTITTRLEDPHLCAKCAARVAANHERAVRKSIEAVLPRCRVVKLPLTWWPKLLP